MRETRKPCSTCLWADQCGNDHPCDDYSPADDTGADFTYYEAVLEESVSEYKKVVAEYVDHPQED